MKNKRLGEMLVDSGAITEEQLQAALAGQKATGKRLGTYLIDEGIISEKQFVETLRMQLGVEFIDLNKASIDPTLTEIVPKDTARTYRLIPVKVEGNNLYIAMEDPMNFRAVEAVRQMTGRRVIPMIAYYDAITRALSVLYENEGAARAIEQMKEEQTTITVDDLSDEMAANDDETAAPTVKLVNSLIERAIAEKASDIHFEPYEKEMKVRIRVDGRLNTMMDVPRELQNSVISRLKVMAGMNITERRIPQDGRAVVKRQDGTQVDLRLNTLPTIFGEKVVIRILMREMNTLNRHAIGITERDNERFDRILKNSAGIILIVGPTGSGKTSTLYTMIHELIDETVNIISLEDPVEFQIAGVTQVAINEKTGLTFASALRSCLRQDPDIICVGEIRDGETAEIAMRAAMTGHLVLSTIHTEDAISAIDRLRDMGAEPYLIAGSLRGVISQRLVRKVCPNCKMPVKPDPFTLSLIGMQDDGTVYYKGRGCERCFGSGFRGRTGVFEILAINAELRDAISEGKNGSELRRYLAKTGFTSMIENGRDLVRQGETTPEELLKVIPTIE